MKQPPKRGRPPGTAKPATTLASIVKFRCATSDKARWVKQAQAQDMTLTSWIIARLDGHPTPADVYPDMAPTKYPSDWIIAEAAKDNRRRREAEEGNQ